MSKLPISEMISLILLFLSILAAVLWKIDFIEEPSVSLIAAISAMVSHVFTLIEKKQVDQSVKFRISVNKKRLFSKKSLIFITLIIFIIFITLVSNGKTTIGIEGDNNNNNTVIIKD